VSLTRRQLLGGAAAAALAGAGVYELVDKLTTAPKRPSVGARPPEQHVLDGVRVVTDNQSRGPTSPTPARSSPARSTTWMHASSRPRRASA
jgi:hypothetical protein